jgi:hypothetical protein
LVIVAPLGRVGPWLPAGDADVQRLREKIIFSVLGWMLITMMILAIVTRDPAQLGRSGGDLVALLTSGHFTY